MDTLKAYLLDLSPAAAFRLFVLALLVGAASLLADVGGLWLVAAPVVVYGCILWYAQHRFFVALNGTLKDSPYFLGFILTLVALIRLFWIASGNAEGLAANPGPLVHDLAEALATTVVGLLFRQALQSLDPGDAARDAAFQTLVTSIRQNAADFYQAQQQLVALVKEFTTAREAMFASEQAAHTRYVQSLSSAATQLADLERAWPERLRELQETLRTTAQQFAATAVSCTGLITTAREELDRTLARAGETVGRAAGEGADALRAAEDALRMRLEGIAAALKDSQDALCTEVAALTETVSTYPAEAMRFSDALGHTSSELATLRTQVAGTADVMQSASQAMSEAVVGIRSSHQEAAQFREDAFTAANETIAESRRVSADVTLRARELLADLQATDMIVEQVLTLLRSRLDQLNATGGYPPPGVGVRR